jgi:hypothetical protein
LVEDPSRPLSPVDFATQDLDLLPRVNGLFRLLELFSEQGSGGVVDKVIISHASVANLADWIKPGAYSSPTKVSD